MCAKRHFNTRQIIIPLSVTQNWDLPNMAQPYLLSWLATMCQKLTPDIGTRFPGTQTHQEWVVCAGLDKEDKVKVPCRSWSKVWLVMLSKQPCPKHRVQNTNRNQKERKGCCWGDGSGQVALLPNTSHCEITDWTVKTLAEQSPKDTGAEGSKIRSARQLMNLHLCVSSGHKYILQQVVEKIRPIVLFRRGSARQSSWMQREGRRETVMCSPPSETAAALPSSRITPNPDSDLTRAGLCTQ